MAKPFHAQPLLRPLAAGMRKPFAPVAGGGGGVDLTNVFNLTTTSGAKIKTAINRVRNSQGLARVLGQGNSTLWGYGSELGFGGNFLHYFRQALIAGGCAARFTSWTGTGSANSNAQYLAYDARFNFYSSTVCTTFAPTVIGAAENVFGGSYIDIASGSDGIDFTVQGPLTNVVVTAQSFPGFATGVISVDGVDLPNQILANTGGALGIVVASNVISVGSGAHVIKIRRASGGALRVMAIISWDAAGSYMDTLQNGVPSSRIAFHNDGTYPSSPRNATMFDLMRTTGTPGAVPVDFAFIDLTINDSNGGTSVATWSTAMQSLITAYQTRGLQTVILIGPPSDTVQATNGTLDAYIAEAKVIALAKDCPVFDLKARWGSYAASVSKYADNTPGHPNSSGYSDWGGWVGKTLVDFAKAA